MTDWYDVAQLCLNGHIITITARSSPALMAKFCDLCGEPTTTTCARCGTEIRGHFHVAGVISDVDSGPPPAFCHECGRPFPWTEAALRAAQELASELVGLTADERDQLAKTLPDIIRDTPQTGLASTRFKRLIAKAGPAGLEGFRKLLTDIASETAAKIILGGK